MSISKSSCDHDNAVQVGMYSRTETVAVEVYTEDDVDVVDQPRLFHYYVLCCPACGTYIQTDSAGFWLDADHTLDIDFIRERPDPTEEEAEEPVWCDECGSRVYLDEERGNYPCSRCEAEQRAENGEDY